MKKSFATGIAVLLPIALTLIVVFFFINLLTRPFVEIVSDFLQRFNLLQKGFLFLSATQVQKYFSQFFILILLFFFTVFLGFLARQVFMHYIFKIGNYIFLKIPFVRTIYKTTQDVIRTLFRSRAKSFKQVVLVPFPSLETYSIGLITKERVTGVIKDRELVAVFVPTTPNPTSGFLMMFNKKDLKYLDISVEDALKYIISLGVISTPIKFLNEIKEKNK